MRTKKELVRKSWHVIAGLLAVPFVLYTGLGFTTLFASATVLTVIALEVLATRGLGIPFFTEQLLRTRRPGETFSWAALTFVTTGIVLLWLTPTPVAFAAIALLGLGDGFSALIGLRYGRHKLPWNRRKSWEGSLAGLAAGFLGAVVLTAWYFLDRGEAYPPPFVWIVLAGAVAAMAAESTPDQQDNLTVPLAAGLVMGVLWPALGLEPRFGELVEMLF